MSRVVEQPPAPGTPEWQTVVSASKVPVILGLSPWDSPFKLWHEMNGDLEPDDVTGDHLDWGHDVEESLVRWWLRHNRDDGWAANRSEIAYSNDQLDFPNIATLDRRGFNRSRPKGHRYRVLECKTSRDLNTWRRPGDPDESGQTVRLDYLTQATFQMGVTGWREADVIALGAGTPEIHRVRWDQELWDMIVRACEDWHQSLLAGNPPPLDDTVATYDAVRALHPDIDRDKDVQIAPEDAEELLAALRVEEDHKKIATGIKSRILDQMGDARRAMVGDIPILTRTPGRGNSITARVNKAARI